MTTLEQQIHLAVYDLTAQLVYLYGRATIGELATTAERIPLASSRQAPRTTRRAIVKGSGRARSGSPRPPGSVKRSGHLSEVR